MARQGGGATYELIGVCARSGAPDAVWTYYVAHMPASEWKQRATIPTVGASNAPCVYKYCWTQDAGHGTTLIVTLKNMQMKGNGAEFTIVYEIFG